MRTGLQDWRVGGGGEHVATTMKDIAIVIVMARAEHKYKGTKRKVVVYIRETCHFILTPPWSPTSRPPPV